MTPGRSWRSKNSWKTFEDTYIERHPLTENEDERKTENLKHHPWERRKSLGKATFREQRRTKIRTLTAYLRVLQFGRTEEPPLYQILDSQSARRQKIQRNACKVLELHQSRTGGSTGHKDTRTVTKT